MVRTCLNFSESVLFIGVPMPDHALPSEGSHHSPGVIYIFLSAVAGVVACAVTLYVLGKHLAKD